MAPALTILVVVSAAVAYYMGWSYKRAYLTEWGLNSSDFSYNP
jgi:hypothetical protein